MAMVYTTTQLLLCITIGLRVSLETNKISYQPGDKVRLNIKTEDARGRKPLAAVVGITGI